ncbi:MAG: DUF342 domain-containing protein [Planctomycetes bacterium]|nr:DUF342 domain-containing protein [Planctomycetota bacterium]
MSEESVNRITDQAVEARGFVMYADDEWLSLYLELRSGVAIDALYEYLHSREISEGLDDAKIAQMVEDFSEGKEVERELIASGKPVRHGRDGFLEFQINMESNKVEVSDAEGNVDFRDLNLIKEIHSGAPILKIIPPDEGEDGIDITGKTLQAIKGKKTKVRLGKNVHMEEKTNTIYATADGHVEYVDPLVSVNEEFLVNSDVDFTIGNLNFIGSLVFEKSIPPGFTMIAGKNITVNGVVTGSNLVAKGDITAENGITGSENTKIECDGILRSKFLNEAIVLTKGGVICYYEMVRSQVKTLGRLVIENGAIRGGEVYALEGVLAHELGAPLGTPTFISVGVDFSVDGKIEKLNGAIEQLAEQKAKYQEAIDPFMKNKFLLLKAPESKKSAVKTILNKIEGLKKKQKQIEVMISDQETKRFDRTKEVEINGAILDDVTITIGNKKKKFDKFGRRKGAILYDKKSFEIVFSRRT